MKKALLTFLVAASVVAAACGSVSNGGKSGGTHEYGGNVSIVQFATSGGSFNIAAASFVSSAGTFSESLPDLDVCVTAASPTPTATPGPTPHALDAGATVTLTSGATTISLTNSSNSYQAQPPTVSPGADYDVALAGGADIAAMSFPHALHLPLAPLAGASASIDAGGKITWSAAGGDYVTLGFFSGATAGATCTVRDDGSFTLPSAVLAAIPASGSLIISSLKTTYVTIDGRDVSLSGNSGALVSYTKQ